MLNKPSGKFTLVDMTALAGAAAVISIFFLRVSSVLEYHWQWESIPSYFIFRDNETGRLTLNILATGFMTTIKLSIWSTCLGFFIGIISGIMGAKGSFEQKFISRVYVESIRNIPSLVLVIFFYYFISSQFLDSLNLDGLLRKSPDAVSNIAGILFSGPDQINSFVSAIVALGIYEGAYISEIIRGGINSIPSGQWEAAGSIGLSRRQSFLLVILPQTFRKTAFPLAGQFISTIKDSAIVSVISIQELTFQGMELMSATFLTFEIWITITLMYFMLTFPCSRIISVLERKYTLRH